MLALIAMITATAFAADSASSTVTCNAEVTDASGALDKLTWHCPAGTICGGAHRSYRGIPALAWWGDCLQSRWYGMTTTTVKCD